MGWKTTNTWFFLANYGILQNFCIDNNIYLIRPAIIVNNLDE